MNRAIVTTMIGPEGELMGSMSIPRMEDYAKKVNARLIVIKTLYPPFDFIAMSKFFMERHLPVYKEGIFYMDIDTIINREAPDIFDIMPNTGMGAVWDSKTESPNPEWNKFIKASAALVEIDPWEGYFNAGVLFFRQDSLPVFSNPEYFRLMPWFPDQTIINLNRARFNIPLHIFDKKWNLMGQNGGNMETWSKCYVAHFAGVDMQTRLNQMYEVNNILP